MAKAKKKVSGDAAGTPSASALRLDPKQARRGLDDAVRDRDAKRGEKATSRAKAWIVTLETLEQLLGDLDWIEGKQTYSVWIDAKDAAQYAREWGETLEQAREFLRGLEEECLRQWLEDAANRAALIDTNLHDPILRTCRRIFAGMFYELDIDGLERARVRDTRAMIVSDLGASIKAIERLLEADLELARKSGGFRPPAPEVESTVLRVLLRADTALSAEEIAKSLKNGEHGYGYAIDAKGVHDAIGRLREYCGLKIESSGRGFRLDGVDRANARAFGFDETPDGTDGT
jgi:hypothetical protein